MPRRAARPFPLALGRLAATQRARFATEFTQVLDVDAGRIAVSVAGTRGMVTIAAESAAGGSLAGFWRRFHIVFLRLSATTRCSGW